MLLHATCLPGNWISLQDLPCLRCQSLLLCHGQRIGTNLLMCMLEFSSEKIPSFHFYFHSYLFHFYSIFIFEIIPNFNSNFHWWISIIFILLFIFVHYDNTGSYSVWKWLMSTWFSFSVHSDIGLNVKSAITTVLLACLRVHCTVCKVHCPQWVVSTKV